MELGKKIELQIKKTLKETKIKKNNKILVALSGGKDSTLVAYFLKKLGYSIEGFHIDLKIGKYGEKCLNAVKELCIKLGINLHIHDIKNEMGAGMCYLRSSIQIRKKGNLKNCAICGVIKKWIMNKEARKLKVDFVATGHNLDDEAQTFLMNILKGSPKLSANIGETTKNSSDKKFIPRLKPLFYVLEKDIRKYTKQKKLPIVYEKCPCSLDSYRVQTREFLNSLPEKNKENILKNFKRVYKKIEKMKTGKLKYCEVCGEPTRKKVCKKCELLTK
jgi:tRNA-5-methyluridine54 2-sulfurtransferase